jgi:ADP-ribose pyrophosphatase
MSGKPASGDLLTDTEIVPWQVLSREVALDASPWLRCWVETVKLPTGKVYDDFYTVEMRDFAIVFALTDDGNVVAERNYRHGLGEVATVLPAGFIDDGEAPLAAAQRELREETGYEASDWRPLGRYVLDGNRGCGHMHAFLARQARQAGRQELDEMEQIQVELLPLERLSDMLLNGEIRTIATAAATGMALHVMAHEKTPPTAGTPSHATGASSEGVWGSSPTHNTGKVTA